MGYILGLDIGITSIGWGILDINEEFEPYKINNLGVRIFERAENPKDGAALALPRRVAREARRRNRRKKHRLERIRKLVIRKGILTEKELAELYMGQLTDIYEIRYKALDEKLIVQDWIRLLIHLAQRRGFKSNRKKANIKEDGKLLAAIQENQNLLQEKAYRTPGEMFYKDIVYKNHKRNTNEDYLCTLSRQMLVEEIEMLFERQRLFGNPYADQAFQQEYLAIYTSQRSFDEGPGGDSPYRNPLEKMIGKCTFESNEMRACKASYSFQYLRLLLDINNLKFKRAGEICRASEEERAAIIALAFSKEKVTYKHLRDILGLAEKDTFSAIHLGKKEKEEVEEKRVFCKLEGYHILRKALDKIRKNYIQSLGSQEIDEIAYALTLYKTDEKIRAYLEARGLAEEVIHAVEGTSFSQYGHLSIKALKRIIPYLEQGMTYDKACEAAGYAFNQIKLPATKKEFIEQIPNPVVRRAVSQSIKVVEAIIRQYGKPAKIHIELAREMGKSFDERKKIEKAQEQNRTVNEKLKKEIEDIYGIKASGNTLVKYKLWKEQQGHCMYSNMYISPDRLLLDEQLTDIDHIIPYSKSFDDTYNNKVLVLASENRQKGNRIPFEYLSSQVGRWEEFQEWTRLYIRNEAKKQRLLKKNIDEEELQEFKERHLNDTRYITSLVAQYLREKIDYDATHKINKRVIEVNGSITAYCRKRWGLTKVRENGDLHHALDAVVIACITPGIIQKVTRYHQIRENELEKNIPFPEPWLKFRDELVARLEPDPNIMLKNLKLATYDSREVKPVFVSRMPRRKNTGAAHKETLKGSKLKDKGYSIVRTPLTQLKLKDGEIEGYYNKEANIKLYEALKERLLAYDGDATRAFEKTFYKPEGKSKQLIEVKKVRIQERTNLMVDVNKGKSVADNDSMVRIDIFKKQNKYYIVPVYIKDIVAERLPNKAIVANKPYDKWLEMDETFEFQFTLYPNDLLYFSHKKGAKFKTTNKKEKKECIIKEGFVYYTSAMSSTGGIAVKTHDNKYNAINMGVQTLLAFEKYRVDELGQITKVKKETRLDYSNKKR